MMRDRPYPDQPNSPVDLHDLMPHRVRNILLVSSMYDSFIIEEDGQITDVVLNDYLNLNLRFAPSFSRAASAAEALEMVKQRPVDAIITMQRIGGMNLDEFTREVRELRPDIPIILLAYDTPELERFCVDPGTCNLDHLFVWNGDTRIFLAIIKQIEDRLNVQHDVEKGNVRLILVTEDSPRFYSSFLPLIYTEIVKQTRSLLSEGLNDMDRALRMRARPKILLARSFEEAYGYVDRYEHNILGIVSDVRFWRKGVIDHNAGFDFVRYLKKRSPDLPVVMQSANSENEELARELGAVFINKHSPTMLQEMRHFMKTNMGFGDFVFRLPDGQEVARAGNMRMLEKILYVLPDESIRYHAGKNHFSNWLMARGEFLLAETLRPLRVSEFADMDELRNFLITSISRQRARHYEGIIADFSRNEFSSEIKFTRLGNGSIGGKARGIAFINAMLAHSDVHTRYPNIRIRVPHTTVLSTDIFDAFIEQNNLAGIGDEGLSDAEIALRFRQGRFTRKVVKDLEIVTQQIHYPLAVRSSSLLEDSQYQPFAGLYHTYMIPNNHPQKSVRLKQLLLAIKYIYASVYFRDAVLYSRATAHRKEEEKMAVIIQEMAGRRYGRYFYPTLAGVAQSWNFYPVSHMQPEDGLALVALGLGRTVVDGGSSVRFSPRHPHIMPMGNDPELLLDQSQKEFYALELDPEHSRLEVDEASTLDLLPLQQAEDDQVLNFVGSVFMPGDNRIYDGIHYEGVRLVTFNNILKHGVFPLAPILADLLDMAEQGMGTDAEIEFAVSIDPEGREPAELSFLQVRPLVVGQAHGDVLVPEVDPENDFCYSGNTLGNGLYQVRRLLWVDSERFDPLDSRRAAEEIATLNSRLQEEGQTCLLIGPGRWGSSDTTLGIPVTWPQICQAKVIVEVGLARLAAEASQGSHFFQNLTSMRIGYFTVHPGDPADWIREDMLRDLPVVQQGHYARLLQPDQLWHIYMDGRQGTGLIRPYGSDFS